MAKSYNAKNPSWYMDEETQNSLKQEARKQRNQIRQERRMRDQDQTFVPSRGKNTNPLMW
jgi:hypothetical protein